MEIIDFHFSPLLSVALPLFHFPPLPHPGSYLWVGGDLLVSGAASIPYISDEAQDSGLLQMCVCVCAYVKRFG